MLAAAVQIIGTDLNYGGEIAQAKIMIKWDQGF